MRGCDWQAVAAGDLFVIETPAAADMARRPGSGAPGSGPGVTGDHCDATDHCDALWRV